MDELKVNKITLEFSNGVRWTIGSQNFDFKLTNNELVLRSKQKGIKQQIAEPIYTSIKEIA